MNAPHPHRVMFVDDEEGVRASWNRFLAERGFEVTTAEDGMKAIGQLESEAPVDVVVADLRMPGLDGLQLLEWVQEKRPDTPFILLTGYGNDEVEHRARELGVYEYLNKPISPEALATVITAASRYHERKVKREAAARAEAELEAAEAEEMTVETQPLERPEVERGRFRSGLETAGALIAAPFLGLAFVVFLPFIGVAALFWSLGERIVKGKAPVEP
jgi:DNA-binding NtrC family response regulator